MKIIRTVAQLRDITGDWRASGARVAVVPTMGALHDGHLSLVQAARQGADRVIVTLFVNPRQFNNPDDLAKYPRTEESDARILRPLGVDALYIPAPEEMYPTGFDTTVSVRGVSDGLCGAHRPGHFDGVATVVAKLFLQTGADRGYFGEKDFQQLQVVRRMAQDLNLPVQVLGCATVREADGLAMSSRNTRLDAQARAIAPALYQALERAAFAIRGGQGVAAVIEAARAGILAAGFEQVEYLELRSENGLRPMTVIDEPARLLVAAWLGGVRLIDNISV